MKTLSIIQVLSKIGKILSKISYIFCIIGAVGCAIGIACLLFADTGALGVLKIGGVTIYSLIVDRAGIELDITTFRITQENSQPLFCRIFLYQKSFSLCEEALRASRVPFLHILQMILFRSRKIGF